MNKSRIEPSSFEFLKSLKKNNDREWFAKNKERYLDELQKIDVFAGSLLAEMNKHDMIETSTGKKSLHRIYRDIRFSNDKTPYNTHWGGGFKREGKHRRGSYYFHFEPGKSFVAGGFWGPNPEDLKRIRDEFSFDPIPMRKILKSKNFVAYFGKLAGEQVKTTPRGFAASDGAIDLLRYKQFLLIRKFSDKEVLSTSFLSELDRTFRQMRPFLNYMSEILSTSVNGEAL